MRKDAFTGAFLWNLWLFKELGKVLWKVFLSIPDILIKKASSTFRRIFLGYCTEYEAVGLLFAKLWWTGWGKWLLVQTDPAKQARTFGKIGKRTAVLFLPRNITCQANRNNSYSEARDVSSLQVEAANLSLQQQFFIAQEGDEEEIWHSLWHEFNNLSSWKTSLSMYFNVFANSVLGLRRSQLPQISIVLNVVSNV